MTENEAIERLQCMRLFMEIEDKNNKSKFLEDDYIANKIAIQALEEIQQHRAIGTIEEFKALKEKSVERKANDIENVIPYGTKIIYHGEKGWKNCQCYCGHYNKEDDTYNIYNVWDLCHVPKEYIEIFDWSE